MNTHLLPRLPAAACALALLCSPVLDARDLTPGVYREYSVNCRQGEWWRVTDPAVTRDDARIYLPNHQFTIADVDLTGAIRAEIAMHHWAGHGGTEGQRFVLNGVHTVDIPINPNVTGLPVAGKLYLNCDNPVFDIPLEWLQAGDNTIEGTIAPEFQGHHWWGQWGWYWISLRVWCDESSVDAPEGVLSIDTEGTVIDTGTVNLEFTPADGEVVNKVAFFARYYGFDEDGDNRFYDWHGFDSAATQTEGNVGTDARPPFAASWDVSVIPDQQRGAVSFTAIVRKGNVCRVLEPLEGYTVERDYSVKLFRATAYPLVLVRDLATVTANVPIPASYGIRDATSARLLMRSWNGGNNEEQSTPVAFNTSPYLTGLIVGTDHYYGMDDKPFAVGYLRAGANTLRFTSQTAHHGCEVLVPGPAIIARWDWPIPDYLDSRTEVPGWYQSTTGWTYYFPAQPDWQYSNALGWLYVYSPHNGKSWSFSSEIGHVWTGFFPWVYAGDDDWLYFVAREGAQMRFYSTAQGREILLPNGP